MNLPATADNIRLAFTPFGKSAGIISIKRLFVNLNNMKDVEHEQKGITYQRT